MKKILVVQPTERVTTAELVGMHNYIESGIKDGFLVLNKHIAYEIIEIGEDEECNR